MPALLLNSITDADASSASQVVVTGSHGGYYAAYCASRARLRGVIFNDAGRGLDDAGIAGAMALADTGLAAATVAHSSCRIGQAEEAHQQGVISAVNRIALALGIVPEMSCTTAVEILHKAPEPTDFLPVVDEVRETVVLGTRTTPREVRLLDSASLVSSDDAGHIVVTGSHGGLIGSDPARALKSDARIAVFNDAGIGLNNAGITRLAALEKRQIAAVTVAHTSARIGDARSMLDHGLISCVNQSAEHLGASPGMVLHTWLDTVQI